MAAECPDDECGDSGDGHSLPTSDTTMKEDEDDLCSFRNVAGQHAAAGSSITKEY